MGFKIKLKKPKIKISAPKAIASTIGKLTNPISNAVAGAGKGLEKVVSSAAKGDIKGVAGAGMGLLDTAKDLAKNSALSNLSMGTGALGALGSLTGAKDLSKVAGNIDAEAKRGSDTYGDAVLEGGANALSTGGYSAGKTALQGLASDGLKGILSGKGLQDAALGMAGSYAGVDPNMLNMAKTAASGDLKGAALQQLAGKTSIDPSILKQVSTGKFDVKDLAKNANLTAAIGGALPGQAYLPGSVQDMIKQGQSAGRVVADVNNAKRTLESVPEYIKNKAGKSIKNPQFVQETAAMEKDLRKKALIAKNQDILNAGKRQTELQSDADFYTPGQVGEEKWTMDRVLGNVKREAGNAVDNITSGVKGAVGAAGNFIKENPMLATGAIQAGAATAGYMAGDAARDKQQKLLEQQILDTQGVDALKNYQQSKQREDAYAQQDKYQQDVIAGGGRTAQQAQIEQEGQLKAAGMDAGARLAGVEQQARMGQGVTGAGSGLAAALVGGQSGANTRSAAARESNSSAAQNLKETYGTRATALENKAMGDINLASLKDQMELRRVGEIGDVRTAQGTMAAQAGDAQGRLAAGLADIATRGVLGQQIGPSDATAQEREIAAQGQVDKDKAALATKATAAGNVSGTAPTPSNATNAGRAPASTRVPTTQADKFNQAGQAPKPQPAPQPGQGQGYGVLAPIQDIAKNPTQAIKNPGQAIQAVQQVVKNPQAAIDEAKKKAEEAAKKAAGSIVPDSMKNIFGMNK
jgi:hypothetical protein